MPSDLKLEQSYRVSVWRAVQPPMPAKAKSVPEAFRQLASAVRQADLAPPSDVSSLQPDRMSFLRAVQPPMPVNHKISSALPLPESIRCSPKDSW